MFERCFTALAMVVLGGAGAAGKPAAPYRLSATVPLGLPDRWDYVVVDATGARVYVAHGDQLAVIDARAPALIGKVEGIAGGTHGTAISASGRFGVTDDGRNGLAVVFDPLSLKVIKMIKADEDADAIAADPLTGQIFIVAGDPAAITVIDPVKEAAIATIMVGEKLEYAVPGEPGVIYVAGEEKNDLVKIDARTDRVVAHWPAPGCVSPHGLAYDAADKRLFLGCANARMMVLGTDNGRVVADLAIGRGNDAVAFDPVRRRVFSSNGVDGTVTIYQQRSADSYMALAPLTTLVSGRTMAVDQTTGRLFVAAAETHPSEVPGGRPEPVPGSLRVLVYDPLP